MKPPQYFIGIDTSKRTLDLAIIKSDTVIAQYKIENSESALRLILKTLKTEYNCHLRNSIICVEQMGLYNAFICKVCMRKKQPLWLESPLKLKRSLGIARGKNDAIDAIRIARYARDHVAEFKPWQPNRPVLEKLKALSKIRNRIIRTRLALVNNKKSETFFLSKKDAAELSGYTSASVTALDNDLESIEIEMDKLISSDQKPSHLVEIITSVPRIGKVIATEMILYTNEFQPGWTAKKFASYCGIAPFEWKSGESIKGKTRVSFFGNKDIKSLLHMSAVGFARSYKTSPLRLFYERKVAEGKNKMMIINAIRNKLVRRIFACVQSDKPYSEFSATV